MDHYAVYKQQEARKRYLLSVWKRGFIQGIWVMGIVYSVVAALFFMIGG